MQKTSPTTAHHSLLSPNFGKISLILTLLLSIGVPMAPLHANPHGASSYACVGGRGYYQSPQCGWSENCNRGGWLGTGVPNGLGWTLFGLSAAASISRPTYLVPTPVMVHQPVYIQQPVVVSRPAVIYSPMVNYNDGPSYYMRGNCPQATSIRY